MPPVSSKTTRARAPSRWQNTSVGCCTSKHFSQAYRPEEATANLKRLYADLVAMQSGDVPRPRYARSTEIRD